MKELFASHEKKLILLTGFNLLFLIYDKYISQSPLSFATAVGLAVFSYIIIASDVVVSAFRTLFKQHRMSEQFLMMIATFGAFALGDLPEAIAVMFFYKIGELFEDYASNRSKNEISSLVKLKPTKVRVIRDSKELQLHPKEVKVGESIRILKGDLVALDGVLLDDSAAIDTKTLTGESEPRLYLKGEEIPSGCINEGGVITLRVSKNYRNSSIVRLLNLIEDAVSNKSRPENLIRRFAVWYTPIVVSVACILALIPIFIKDALFSDWIERALVFLVVSCPCALVLSVPLSFLGGMSAISKIGVIVKGSVHIETMARLKGIAFDKTGTLTEGDFKISKINAINADENTILLMAASLESGSNHPVALSIVKEAKNRDLELLGALNIKESSGLGIEGDIEGNKVYAGKVDFIKNHTVLCDKIDTTPGRNCVYVAVEGKLLGVIELFDELKKDARSCIAALTDKSIATCLITGDRKEVALAIKDELKLKDVFYEKSPEDKLACFKDFKQRYKPSAFCGDGINDALVLSSCDVGFAMGDIGQAAALEAADVVVLNDSLDAVFKTIVISKRIYSLAISNMYFVMAVKLGILILGALGFANIWLAIAGDVGVLILAVINAMRTMGFKVK